VASGAPLTREETGRRWAAALGGVAVMALVSAFVMQYGFGLLPCHLCILERWPYAVGAAAVLVGLLVRQPRLALVIFGLAMLTGSAIATYHVGVEQGTFALPESCLAAERAQSIEQLREMLQTAPPRCDQITAQFFGLSLATWNLLFSLLLVVAAAVGWWTSRAATR
jgi:disulfide bond formation protein DsbB